MYDPNLCDLCQERAKVPGAELQGDLIHLELCLDCRRIEIQTDGVIKPDRYSPEFGREYHSDDLCQLAFESDMIPLGRAVSRIRRNFA